jgi:hypothetical protein
LDPPNSSRLPGKSPNDSKDNVHLETRTQRVCLAAAIKTVEPGAYFFAALTFAQRALCAAAILFRPAAEIVRFLRVAGLFASMRVDLPERRQGSGYAVQFILKSGAFLRFLCTLFALWDEPRTKTQSDDIEDDSHQCQTKGAKHSILEATDGRNGCL